MTNTLPIRAACLGWLLLACGVAPSRAPLGGSYILPESAPAGDRRAQPAPSAAPDASASEPVTAAVVASAIPALPSASAVAPLVAADTIRFEPFQVGSRIKGEVTLSASAEMRGGPPGMTSNAKFAFDGRMQVEFEVRKASAQSLDELELTLTTLAMHGEFAGEDLDIKPGSPPESYNIDLSGASPIIRPRAGATLNPVSRVEIAIFVAPLVEFYAHWARSPALELKPGWTSKVPLPVATTLFTAGSNETLRVGPLNTRFTARASASDDAPFELALPIEYVSAVGKLKFDLSGSAKLNAKSGRPTAFEVSGPLNAAGGPRGVQMSVNGKVKFAGTFSYP